MKTNKGFTLIELLAVIVILAIIALIATPIILNIISDSKEESNKRSVEMYGSAVKNAVAKYQLNGTEIPAGDLSSSLLSTVEYSGNAVTCTTNKLYEDGGIYLAGCTVGSDTKEYTYGTEQTQDRYAYMTYTGSDVSGPSIGGDASSLSTSAPAGYYYLKFKLDDENKVIESWACDVYSGKETCLRGGSADFYGYAENEADWTGNYLILKGLESEGISCFFDGDSSRCRFDYDVYHDVSVFLFAHPDGSVGSGSGDGVGHCNVYDDGSSLCRTF